MFFDATVTACIKNGEWSAYGIFKVRDTCDFDYNKKDAQNALTSYLNNGNQNAGNFQSKHAVGELKTMVMAEVQKIDTQSKIFAGNFDCLPITGQDFDEKSLSWNARAWPINLPTEKIYSSVDVYSLQSEIATNQIKLPSIQTDPAEVFF